MSNAYLTSDYGFGTNIGLARSSIEGITTHQMLIPTQCCAVLVATWGEVVSDYCHPHTTAGDH